MSDKIFYTIGEVAKITRTSESTIRRRIKEGKVPVSNLVNHIRIPAWYIYELVGESLAAIEETKRENKPVNKKKRLIIKQKKVEEDEIQKEEKIYEYDIDKIQGKPFSVLRGYRLLCGLTQDQLTDKLNISHSTYSLKECGKSIFTYDQCVIIANEINKVLLKKNMNQVTIDELFER